MYNLTGRSARIAQLLVLLALTVAAYGNTFHVPFQFDDEFHIAGNPLVREPYKLLLPSKAKEEAVTLDMRAQMRTRILAYLSFALNYDINGASTSGYHMVNLLIHLSNALLLYLLVLWLIAATNDQERAVAHWIAIASATLFALHPIQTQAVTYISQRFASMSTMLYICSVALYVRHRASGALWWLPVSMALALGAMHTKEVTFTLPFALVLVEITFPVGSPKQRIIRLAPYLALLPIIPAYILMQSSGLDAATSTPTSIPRWTYFLTSIRVLTTYIRMLALPYGQSVDHDYALSESPLESGVLLSAALLVMLLAAAMMLYRRASKSDDGQALSARLNLLAAFGVLWFFTTISVENSFIALDHVIYEHRLYLPSVGIFIAAVTIIAQHLIYIESRGMKTAFKAAGIVAIALAIALSAATYARNEAWRDPLTLWRDAAAKAPHKVRPMLNLGAILSEKGEHEEAMRLVLEAVRLEPGSWSAHFNLGSVLMRAGRLDAAHTEFVKATELGGGSADLFNNLGIVQARLGMTSEALISLKRAVDISPHQPGPAYNLGRLHLHSGEREKGVRYIELSMRLDDKAAMPHYTMAALHLGEGNSNTAISSLEEAIKREPAHIPSHLMLAAIYESMGMNEKAASHRALAAR